MPISIRDFYPDEQLSSQHVRSQHRARFLSLGGLGERYFGASFACADVLPEPCAGGRRQMTTRAAGGIRTGLENAPLVRHFHVHSWRPKTLWDCPVSKALSRTDYRSHFIGSTLGIGPVCVAGRSFRGSNPFC
jgi:hypothetical protein